MSKLLMQLLGHYNRQLSAELARAEMEWPALCEADDELLSRAELQERRQALLMVMTYSDQLRRLIRRQADQHEADAFWVSSHLLPPDISPAR